MTTTATSFEQPRMKIGRAAPPLHRALVTLGNQLELNPRLRELVNLRASILNGCAYCIDMHTKIARKAGESEQRLYAVAAQHEAAFFDAKERAALALTDAVTLIAEQHVPRDVWDEASAHFEPDELAQLVWAITVINAWNRIAITTRMLPAAQVPLVTRTSQTVECQWQNVLQKLAHARPGRANWAHALLSAQPGSHRTERVQATRLERFLQDATGT